jgi:DNA repair protein RadC
VLEVALVLRGTRPLGAEPVDVEVAGRFFADWIGHETCECLAVLLIDSRRQALACELVSRGGIGSVPIHPGPLLRTAVREGAAGLYVSHNHPSGDPSPSDADVEATARLCAAAGIVQVQVYDHLVCAAGGRWASIREVLEERTAAERADRAARACADRYRRSR